jgi:hypothetical protein
MFCEMKGINRSEHLHYYLLAYDKVNLVGSYHFRLQPKDGAFATHGTIETEKKCPKSSYRVSTPHNITVAPDWARSNYSAWSFRFVGGSIRLIT